ncbi:MAG: glycosyltransferase [Lachnospiraceae bacterium]|nr:glycosyltransferase [Lachnospiraceae bacterium]
MVKILFIINNFTAGGGAEAVLTSIVNNLDESKYNIGIVEIIHSGIKQEKLKKSIKIYPYYVEADDPDRKKKMYSVYHEWEAVRERLIPKDYDVYISFNYLKPTFLLPPNKKSISWIHGDMYNLLSDNLSEERELQRTAFTNVNRIVAISDITRQSIEDIFPEYKLKICDIYNGVDISEVRRKALQQTDVRLEKKSILAVGRLDDNKNPMRLLKVFGDVKKRVWDAHLYYLGYGHLIDQVKEKSKEMGIENCVHCLGYYDNPFPIINQCKVVGMMSKSEGFPMALLEAAALGKPFVATKVGGASVLSANGKCGRVIMEDEQAVNAFADYLCDDRINHDIMEEIEKYDIKEYIRKIENLIDNVLDET